MDNEKTINFECKDTKLDHIYNETIPLNNFEEFIKDSNNKNMIYQIIKVC